MYAVSLVKIYFRVWIDVVCALTYCYDKHQVDVLPINTRVMTVRLRKVHWIIMIRVFEGIVFIHPSIQGDGDKCPSTLGSRRYNITCGRDFCMIWSFQPYSGHAHSSGARIQVRQLQIQKPCI